MLQLHRAAPQDRRLLVRLFAVLIAFASLFPLQAVAHEGHDHGPAPVALPITSQPRATATGDEFEAVAILQNGELLIFIDRVADNVPVQGARVSVIINNQEISARAEADGTYRSTIAELVQPGRHDVVIAVQNGDTNDLLVASLETPASSVATAAVAAPPVKRGLAWLRTHLLLTSLTALAFTALAGMLVMRRKPGQRAPPEAASSASSGHAARRRSPLSVQTPLNLVVLALILATTALTGQPTFAHEGEEHAAIAPAAFAITGDAPRRLPDGSVFVPKPTQRLLAVRTLVTTETAQQPSQSLVGRVIANPNRSGVVQSSTGGRLTPSSTGLPRLGQSVKAGDILAYVTPAFLAIDSANVAQTAGDLDQQLEIARNKNDRLQKLLATNATSRALAEDAQLTLQGLERRRAALKTSQVRSEPLLAPVDGVISATKAVPGQVVAPQDILFEIIDARSLWVEAFVFDPSLVSFENPVANTFDGTTFALTFVGRSRSLRQQSAILQFETNAPPASLDVGTPVTVHAQAGERVTAITLPKTAIVRSPNGEDIVWRHAEPERFVAHAVKVAPFDGTRVRILAGLTPGQRIVVESAELINQVR